MPAKYILSKAVVGISNADQQITTLPLGATVEVATWPHRVGTVQALWQGQSLTLLLQDLEQNGTLGEQGQAQTLAVFSPGSNGNSLGSESGYFSQGIPPDQTWKTQGLVLPTLRLIQEMPLGSE